MFLKRVKVLFLVVGFLVSISYHPINLAIALPVSPDVSHQSQSGFFTENKGQWDPEILFVGDTSFGKVAFTKNAIFYRLISSPNHGDVTVGSKNAITSNYRSQDIKLTFVNSEAPQVKGDQLLSHYTNYFLGDNPSKWASHCRNFTKITYQNVWSGIDLAYFFTSEGMKYEFYIEPWANVENLQIKVNGAVLSAQCTSLQFVTDIGKIQDSNLKVFDLKTGAIIKTSFQIQNNIIRFQGIPQNRINQIVIDPIIYSTYLGGSGNEGSNQEDRIDITVDRFGYAYVCGYTDSIDFPIEDPIQSIIRNNSDVFITKFNRDGSSLVYSTYLGGKNTESSSSIAVDYDGFPYICGYTNSSDFPLINPFKKYAKGWDAFVIKLNEYGSEILYSTYLGGNDYDYATGIAVDREGFAYVTGYTESLTFPTTDAFQPVKSNVEDAFVSKLNQDGSALVYSTFLGGNNFDQANSISVDPKHNAYICGVTLSNDFPTKNPIQGIKNENLDGFVTKLNEMGDELVFSTYLGGKNIDRVFSVAVDPISTNQFGCTYICGITYSPDFPTKNPIKKDLKGGQDVFVAKLDTQGTSFIYSTYLGGGGFDQAYSITTDPIMYYGDQEPYCTGVAYITGMTNSPDFPTKYPLQTRKSDNFDAFVTKIHEKGSGYLFSTYLGGNNIDRAFGIAVDSEEYIYLCGYTYSTNFPTRRPLQNKLKGLQDAFVTKLTLRY